ncbi:MAG: hypothetical protein WCJ88_08710 [Actinomycetes bacterium]
MTFTLSPRRLRNVVVAVALAAGLTIPIAVAQPAIANAPDVPVAPSGVYPSIDSCTLSLTPASIGSTDSFTVTATFTPATAQFAIGADGLGAAWAEVHMSATSPYILNGPGATIESQIGLAPGTHSMDLYAVDPQGDPLSEPLCSATYQYRTPVAGPIGETPIDLPHATVGIPYGDGVDVGTPNPSTGVVTGVVGASDPSNWWVYTPTSPGDTREVLSCDVKFESSTPVFGPIYEEQGGNGGRGGLFVANLPSYYPIVGGKGGDGGNAGLLGSAPSGSSTLLFGPADQKMGCGTLVGYFWEPGVYTLTQTIHWNPYPSDVAPGSLPSAVPSTVPTGISQVYATHRTLTLVVDMAPAFTG